MKQYTGSKGFTILELLIAVVVFSIMLLIVSTTVLALTRQFYKGLIKSRTQQVARTIIEELATNIQFSSTEPTFLGTNGEVEGWCIADRRYLVVKHKQLGTDPATQSRGVLVRGGGCSDALPSSIGPGPGNVELIGENMRLANLEIRPDNSGEVWEVKVNVVYGGDDLVCDPNAAGDCDSNSTSSNLTAQELMCKLKAGSQFCANAPFEATVARRL